MPVVFDLLRHEGLYLGGSSGVNVAGAVRLAKEMGPGHTIVTVLVRLRNTPVEAVQSGVPALKHLRCRNGWNGPLRCPTCWCEA